MKLALPINPASETNAWVFGSISEVDGKFQFIDQVPYKLCQLFSQPFPSILHLQLEISCPGQLTRYMLKLHLSINLFAYFLSVQSSLPINPIPVTEAHTTEITYIL